MLTLKLFIRRMSLAANRSTDGPIAQAIDTKIRQKFSGMQHFALFNDSYKHAGHHGMEEADNKIESHFRLELVSEAFQGLTLPKRHRQIYNLLDEELKNGVHALQLQTRTPAEQAKKQQQ
ncbi:LANO_0C00958g1_1 [Lachancea nothofagi CBS 11611]|uniref:LANO_0C00958g1_1 n=1 Tax=Lachancea nothofagi CBS 11611 TaxID=1266666 RepID=A0A1G4J3W1_9SACH|nr:LANO_0C00958g1_1 [Lachancea nothofagi CBS 11611]